MIPLRRVVFDTSTLVTAALRIDSIPHQALQKALGSCNICASAETLDELQFVLDRKKFDRYLDRDSRRAFVSLIRRHTHLFAVQTPSSLTIAPPCRDPGDTKFLTLALTAAAAAIISSDEDLVVLHPWRDIPILSPAQFLDI